ncbi:hypothetical protein M438DRAFT_22927 [Aureobasidium pullulans EXF-150]|uniref:Uncharacterized protein n=1 Tax=Aureobasidium pullulans EXF-150 TaxID=1043002 RepID=A0A074XJC4_AURPU|nr:uncharacterized protein M438DRAFT_22927 [Aureobasidium pullulans EXF-150]KEQ83814.1 hypothetical protein M438DRAFT_22927 [Aureobasidium pullulans EXF-150]
MSVHVFEKTFIFSNPIDLTALHETLVIAVILYQLLQTRLMITLEKSTLAFLSDSTSMIDPPGVMVIFSMSRHGKSRYCDICRQP